MPPTLKISDSLSLPIDAATQTFAFIARKGAGKTYAAGKLAECLLDAGVQVVVLDLVGNWFGLRLSADGKSAAYDIPVIGGLRGDIPLEASGGHLIADIVADTGRSMIVDLSQFSKADRQRFALAFGERLWARKKAERQPSPVHVIIEESQLIVPENVSGRAGGDLPRMVGIYEEIIRLGRNYGIGVTMISQRPQSVNKEVLNQTECLFVLQVNGAHERKALKDWITYHGAEKNLVDELPGLPIGTAYIWSPQWLRLLKKVEIGKKKTFDASATPKVGSVQTRRDLKPLDLDDLKERMAATIEKAKAEDPKELRKQIAQLQNEKRALLVKMPPPEPTVERIEVPVLANGSLDRIENLLGKANRLIDSLPAIVDGFKEASRMIAGEIAKTRVPGVAAARSFHEPMLRTNHPTSQHRPIAAQPVQPQQTADGFRPTKKQQEILNALAWFESIGIAEPSTLQVGAVALIDASGGHFSNTVGPLSSQGLVVRGAGSMRLTDAGRAVASVPENVATLDEYHDVLRARVRRMKSAGGRTIEILNTIINRRGGEISTEDIGAEVGIDHTGGHFSNMIGPLGTVGLIERRSGVVRPTEILFPPGLA